MAVATSEHGVSEDLADASSDNEDEPDKPLQQAAGETQAAQRRQHLHLFNRGQYLRGFEEHINELKRVGDPEFALQHCTFLKSAEIEGHALFCASGLYERQFVIEKDFCRRWAVHGKFQYAISEALMFVSRMLRPWRVNLLCMTHPAWPRSGKVASQSQLDTIQESDVGAAKALLPKNLSPTRYYSSMLLASMNSVFLWHLRTHAVPALCGEQPMQSRGSRRTAYRGDVERAVTLFEWAGVWEPSEVRRSPNFFAVRAVVQSRPLTVLARDVEQLMSEKIWGHGSGLTQGLIVVFGGQLETRTVRTSEGQFSHGSVLMAVHTGTSESNNQTLHRARVHPQEGHKRLPLREFLRMAPELGELEKSKYRGNHGVNGLVGIDNSQLSTDGSVVGWMVVGVERESDGVEIVGTLPSEQMRDELNRILEGDAEGVMVRLLDLRPKTLADVLQHSNIPHPPTGKMLRLDLWNPNSPAPGQTGPSKSKAQGAQRKAKTKGSSGAELSASKSAVQSAAGLWGNQPNSVLAQVIVHNAAVRAQQRKAPKPSRVKKPFHISELDHAITDSYHTAKPCADSASLANLCARLEKQRPQAIHALEILRDGPNALMKPQAQAAEAARAALTVQTQAGMSDPEIERRDKLDKQLRELDEKARQLLIKKQTCADVIAACLTQVKQARSNITQLLHMVRACRALSNEPAAAAEGERSENAATRREEALKEYKVIDKELEEVWRAQQALLVLTPPPVVADSSDADEHDEDSEDSGVFAHYLAVIEQQGLNARAITLKLKSLDVAGQATVCPADLPEPCERESRGYPAAALGVLRKHLARVLTDKHFAQDLKADATQEGDSNDPPDEASDGDSEDADGLDSDAE